MTKAQLQSIRQLEGHTVCLALDGGTRIDDAYLVAAGRGGTATLWIYSDQADVIVDADRVLEVWPRTA